MHGSPYARCMHRCMQWGCGEKFIKQQQSVTLVLTIYLTAASRQGCGSICLCVCLCVCLPLGANPKLSLPDERYSPQAPCWIWSRFLLQTFSLYYTIFSQFSIRPNRLCEQRTSLFCSPDSEQSSFTSMKFLSTHHQYLSLSEDGSPSNCDQDYSNTTFIGHSSVHVCQFFFYQKPSLQALDTWLKVL